MSDRTKVATPPQVDHVRNFPNAYEMDAYGGTPGTQPENNWQRGELLRGTMFEAAGYMRPPLAMYDPTILNNPNAWAGPR